MQQNAEKIEPSTWENYSDLIRKKIPGPLFDTFIKPLRPGRDEASGALVLEVPDQKMLEHIRSRYLDVISDILSDTACRGQVRLRSFRDIPSNTDTALRHNDKAEKKKDAYFPCPEHVQQIERLTNLDFPSSVVFLHGGPGTGKTSLLQHLAENWKSGGMDVRILSLETFLTEFSLSLHRKETIRWRNDLRKNRVIAIDDFQFIKGTARKSQEELRNLIEEFREKGHKLILSSEMPAESLPLVPDLASRILESYVMGLSGPSYSTRIKILDHRAKEYNLKLSEESLSYLAKNVVGDARRLNSAIMRIVASEIISPEKLEIDALCGDLFTGIKQVTPDHLLNIAADLLNVTVDAIRGPARDKQITFARHIVAFICTEHMKLSLSKTAEIIARKDHASVIHARNRIQGMMESDLFTARLVEEILNRLINKG